MFNACIKEKGYTGDGEYKEASKEISLNDFSKVGITGGSTVNIQMGDFKIVVKGDSTDLANLKTKVEDGKFYYEYNGYNAKHFGLDFKIYMPSLKYVDISGASNVTLGTFNDENYKVDMSGASVLEAFDFSAKGVDIDMSGASKAKVSASEKLNAELSGASNLVYKGSPVVNSNVSGASTVERNCGILKQNHC